MSIRKDPKTGLFHVQHGKRHPITGQPICRRRVGLKTLAEAKRAEKELIILVEQKIHEQIFPKWCDAVEKYLEHCRNIGLTQKTLYNAECCLHKHTKYWSNRTVDDISTPEIRELIQSPKFNSQSLRKTLLKLIRGVFTIMVEEGILMRNPSPTIKFKISDKIRTVLTKEQARILLTKAKELEWEWYPHVCCALYTGMRNGELFALTWDKVNLENRQILVDCSWNNKDGFKSTKSGDDRMIEIAEPLVPILKQLKVGTDHSEFVLPRVSRWDKGEQARELRMFMLGIGLPPVRFHDLRATWATLLLASGQAPARVMTMGGWKDLKTMMIYMRKAGIDIKGITEGFALHDPVVREGVVIRITDGLTVNK